VATPAPIQQSLSEVPGYAIAYTPKDGPATPPVVIAPEAQSSPENKRPFSVTVPSRVKAPPAPLSPAALSPAFDDDEIYTPKKSNGKLIAGVIGGALVLLIAVVGVRALIGGSTTSTVASDASSTVPNVPPVATPAAAVPAPEAPTAAPIATTEATRTAPSPEPTHAEKPPTHVAAAPPARPQREATATPRPATPAPRPPAATFPSEPAAPSKPAGGKGVIVRDAPF